MEQIVFILLSVLCAGMGGVYTAFYKKTGWQGILVRGLTIVSLIALPLTTANIKSLNNALPIFVCLGLVFLLMTETLFASNNLDAKPKELVFSILYSVGNVLLSLGTLSLAQFNGFGFAGGILLGLGVGLVVCAIKKYKAFYPVIVEILVYSSIGLILGFGLMAVLSSKHMVSAVFMMVAGVTLLAQRIMTSFEKGKVMGYIANGLYVLSLLLISMTIFFY